PFLARSVATCTCLTSANMSGASRVLSSTDGSIFLAAANASALSRIADSALRPISSAGRDAFDIENDMGLTPLLSTTVGWQRCGSKAQPLSHAQCSTVPTASRFAQSNGGHGAAFFREEKQCMLVRTFAHPMPACAGTNEETHRFEAMRPNSCPAGRAGYAARAAASVTPPRAHPSSGPRRAGSSETARPRAGSPRRRSASRCGRCLVQCRRAAAPERERVQHAAKLLLERILAVAGDREGLAHHVRSMIADGARGKLNAVADDVVLDRLDLEDGIVIGRLELEEILDRHVRHRERIMGEVDLLLLLVPLVHREVDDPAELEAVPGDEVQLLAEPGPRRAGNLGGIGLLAGGEKQNVARPQPGLLRHLEQNLVRHKFGDRSASH